CEERGRGGVAASGLGAFGRGFKLIRHGFVGFGDGLSEMPGAAIGILVPVRSLRQRLMDRGSLSRVRGSVDRRARQRMAETRLRAELDQPIGLRRANGKAA